MRLREHMRRDKQGPALQNLLHMERRPLQWWRYGLVSSMTKLVERIPVKIRSFHFFTEYPNRDCKKSSTSIFFPLRVKDNSSRKPDDTEPAILVGYVTVF